MSHSVIYNKIFGSDIFNQEPKPKPASKPVRDSLLRTSSDIFNTKPVKQKPLRIRNNSQSDIFFTDGNTSYSDYKRPPEYKSDYDPNKFLKSSSSYKRKMRELFSLNRSALNLTSSKGYNEYRDLVDNKPPRSESKDRSFNRLKDNHGYDNHHNFDCQLSARENHYEDMKSNIFYDTQKDKKNTVLKMKKIPKESRNTYLSTQPKQISKTARNKWVANLSWKDTKGQFLFETYKSTSQSSKSHKKRSQKNVNDYVKPDIKCDDYAHKKKIEEGISQLNFKENFYHEGYKKSKIPNQDIRDEQFTLQGDEISKENLVKFFTKKGVHIYNVNDETDLIQNGKQKLTFKLRDNDGKGKKAVDELKNQYKKINVQETKKIVVNKRIHPETYSGVRDVYRYNSINNNGMKKPITSKRNNDIDRSFSNGYRNINHSYKSNFQKALVI